MSLESNHLVPYVPPNERERVVVNDSGTSGSVGLFYPRDDDGSIPNESQQIQRLKRWRKRETFVTGLGIGVVLLVALGPAGGIVGGIAGGIAGAYATKKALKRREKKVIDRLMARKYPLVYNRHAVFA